MSSQSTAQLYNGKTIDQLSNSEVLDLAGNHGPAIIGKELYDRAAHLKITTDNGRFGPAILDPDYGLDITPWDDYSRKELLVVAREHSLPVKSNATREELAKELARAKVKPQVPAAGDQGEGAET